jgi:hypothetical protein
VRTTVGQYKPQYFLCNGSNLAIPEHCPGISWGGPRKRGAGERTDTRRAQDLANAAPVKQNRKERKMARKLQALGLAFGVVLAMGALTASSAWAVPEFTGYHTQPPEEHTHTIVVGTTELETIEKFSAATGHVECHVSYEGTLLTGTGKTLTISPTDFRYPNETVEPSCRTHSTALNQDFTTHVSFNSCDYTFHVETKIKIDEYTGSLDVQCTTPGDEIDIKITKNGSLETKCTIKVPAQNGLKHIIFRNERKPAKETHVTAEPTVEKIEYTTEGGLLNCGIANGKRNDGVYTGKVTLGGENTVGEKLDLEVSGE